METLDSASLRPILLVDDEQQLLDATSARIARALPEVEILAFTDGESALSDTADRALGLAILDIDLPGMNGMQVAEALRKRSVELPILFLTGTSKDALADAYEQVGAVGWIQKPAVGQTLIDAITAHALGE